MARAALNWTVRELAEATGLHRNTITNIEVGRYTGDQKSLERIELVLKKAGVEFIDENGGGPECACASSKGKKANGTIDCPGSEHTKLGVLIEPEVRHCGQRAPRPTTGVQCAFTALTRKPRSASMRACAEAHNR